MAKKRIGPNDVKIQSVRQTDAQGNNARDIPADQARQQGLIKPASFDASQRSRVEKLKQNFTPENAQKIIAGERASADQTQKVNALNQEIQNIKDTPLQIPDQIQPPVNPPFAGASPKSTEIAQEFKQGGVGNVVKSELPNLAKGAAITAAVGGAVLTGGALLGAGGAAAAGTAGAATVTTSTALVAPATATTISIAAKSLAPYAVGAAGSIAALLSLTKPAEKAVTESIGSAQAAVSNVEAGIETTDEALATIARAEANLSSLEKSMKRSSILSLKMWITGGADVQEKIASGREDIRNAKAKLVVADQNRRIAEAKAAAGIQ